MGPLPVQHVQPGQRVSRRDAAPGAQGVRARVPAVLRDVAGAQRAPRVFADVLRVHAAPAQARALPRGKHPGRGGLGVHQRRMSRDTHLGKRGALGGDRIPAEVRVPGAPGHWKAPFTPARLLVPHDDDTPDGGLQRGAPPTPETTPNKSKSKSKTQRPFNLSNVPPPSRAHSFDVSLTLSQRHTLQCPVPGGIKVELALRLFMVNGMCVAWRPNLPWMAGNRFACWAVYVHLVRENRPGTLAWWPLVLLDFCFIVALPVFAAWGLEKKARRMFFDECAMTSVWSNGGGFRSRRSRRSSRSGVRSRSSSHGAATPRRMPSPPPLPERRSWWDGLTRRQPAQG